MVFIGSGNLLLFGLRHLLGRRHLPQILRATDGSLPTAPKDFDPLQRFETFAEPLP